MTTARMLTPEQVAAELGVSRATVRVYGRLGPADLDKLIEERGPAMLPSAPGFRARARRWLMREAA